MKYLFKSEFIIQAYQKFLNLLSSMFILLLWFCFFNLCGEPTKVYLRTFPYKFFNASKLLSKESSILEQSHLFKSNR